MRSKVEPTSSHFERSQFATTSRLLACLVNEGLADGCLFRGGLSLSAPVAHLSAAGSNDVRIVVDLMNVPPFLKESPGRYKITFLDPQDIAPLGVYAFNGHALSRASQLLDPVQCFSRLMTIEDNSADTQEGVALVKSQLSNSVGHQAYLYKHRLPTPTLNSAAVEWEQYLVEGHPTHPMHRTRAALPGDPEYLPCDTDKLMHPTLNFISVPQHHPRCSIVAHASWHALTSAYLPAPLRPGDVVIPVHERQVPQILKRFDFLNPLVIPDKTDRAEAMCNLRSVVPSSFPGYHFKLPLAMYMTSCVRTITPFSVYNGPRVSRLTKLIVADGSLLHVVAESGSIGAVGVPEADAKHLSCIVRPDPEALLPSNECIIMAAVLLEKDVTGVPLIIRTLSLTTPAKRIAFLDAYAEKMCDAFLPPMMQHCFAFEAHAQNVLVRIDRETGELVGFAVRDFGGVRFHPETLLASLPELAGNLDMAPGAAILATSPEHVYSKLHHCFMQMHVAQLVRALGLHHSGEGWEIVRRHVRKHVPEGSPAGKVWFAKNTQFKAFVSMKLQGLFRDYVYVPVPNVLLFEGSEDLEAELEAFPVCGGSMEGMMNGGGAGVKRNGKVSGKANGMVNGEVNGNANVVRGGV